MSQQQGTGQPSNWENRQTQQFRQQQCGYLDLPYVPSKKNKASVLKKQQTKGQVAKVWHEGAD